jgi:ABC-2 type transport system permease protein
VIPDAARTPAAASPPPPPPRLAAAETFQTARALVGRDLKVLIQDGPAYLLRVVLQPALFAFVFAFVFPRIGQGIGGSRNTVAFVSILLPGLMANTLMFQGVTAVALPLVTEFSYSKEIEDRVMAPVPVRLVALCKVLSGALQSMIASLLDLPAVWLASGFVARVDWGHPLLLATMLPLGALVGAALGLTMGTVIPPQRINFLFALLLLPLTLLGCVYYPWAALTALPWLRIGVLLNPVVYISEGMRSALSPQIPHMPLGWIYAFLGASLVALLGVGLRSFERRVLA